MNTRSQMCTDHSTHQKHRDKVIVLSCSPAPLLPHHFFLMFLCLPLTFLLPPTPNSHFSPASQLHSAQWNISLLCFYCSLFFKAPLLSLPRLYFFGLLRKTHSATFLCPLSLKKLQDRKSKEFTAGKQTETVTCPHHELLPLCFFFVRLASRN